MLSREETYYLAGFFDGEGTVGLYYNKLHKKWRASIRITQNYSPEAQQLFEYWQRRLGGAIVNAKYPRRDITLQIQSEDRIGYFIATVTDYTVLKRAQLILLRSYLENRTYAYRIHQQLKSLKRKGIR